MMPVQYEYEYPVPPPYHGRPMGVNSEFIFQAGPPARHHVPPPPHAFRGPPPHPHRVHVVQPHPQQHTAYVYPPPALHRHTQHPHHAHHTQHPRPQMPMQQHQPPLAGADVPGATLTPAHNHGAPKRAAPILGTTPAHATPALEPSSARRAIEATPENAVGAVDDGSAYATPAKRNRAAEPAVRREGASADATAEKTAGVVREGTEDDDGAEGRDGLTPMDAIFAAGASFIAILRRRAMTFVVVHTRRVSEFPYFKQRLLHALAYAIASSLSTNATSRSRSHRQAFVAALFLGSATAFPPRLARDHPPRRRPDRCR